MSINYIIARNFRKNIKNYYLYVFALVFSVALYFAFVTLQYDPALEEIKGSIKGEAAIKAGSVLLIAIVTIFLLYANKLFIKRRSKEIGLYQLTGLTKQKIFRILSAENSILYCSSLVIGIFVGFSFSRLVAMVLFKITNVKTSTVLNFSTSALIQTVIVFLIIFLLILLMNYIFIQRQSILSLFRVQSSTEEKVKRVTLNEMVVGLFGIALILTGYYISTRLFSGHFNSVNQLVLAMITILGSVILGTYLFYRGSVRFIFYLIRRQKGGYLNIREVLSLSSIMFRMKSNAILLTVITTVSALAIGLLSLSYISYYSAEKMAKSDSPADFSIVTEQDAEQFKQSLSDQGIGYKETRIEVIRNIADLSQIIDISMDNVILKPDQAEVSVVSAKDVENVQLAEDEMLMAGFSDMLKSMFSYKGSGPVQLHGLHKTIPLQLVGLKKESIVSWPFARGRMPVAIVSDATFEQLKQDLDPQLQAKFTTYFGIDITNRKQLEEANKIFQTLPPGDQLFSNESQLDSTNEQKQMMGLIMFIVGFLGLTFLITSGCILYFKQMDEGEEEKPSFTILRKLGFTQGDLLSGVQIKQLFNFGIPLIIGLSHSYFAVKSGWFMFGTELWTPMFLVMLLYTVLYSIFGILSVIYYKKVIRTAL
ncbi:FtsX-like permease family protein [Paenibacillus motobuensis]|uniref:ABC transporter permease n=1 Tax=Paenibacillus TaxID=44249 RepID=UPI00203F9B08|nr:MULTISPECIES: FtsX-like permease family protein [Paenibacillus]MCM3041154.1 FtsX-like permease family protein [Paenibacillus lutimineralis]MCM3648258.1 FtsX-like permease family protein [Paenibacillus motobuensis]